MHVDTTRRRWATGLPWSSLRPPSYFCFRFERAAAAMKTRRRPEKFSSGAMKIRRRPEKFSRRTTQTDGETDLAAGEPPPPPPMVVRMGAGFESRQRQQLPGAYSVGLNSRDDADSTGAEDTVSAAAPSSSSQAESPAPPPVLEATLVTEREDDERRTGSEIMEAQRVELETESSSLKRTGCIFLVLVVLVVGVTAGVVGGIVGERTRPTQPAQPTRTTSPSPPHPAATEQPSSSQSEQPTQSPVAVEWEQLGQDITGRGPQHNFGYALDLSETGRVVAVGAWRAPGGNVREAGRVEVFGYNGTSLWSRLGAELVGTSNRERLGWSVSLDSDGQFLAVGGPQSGIGGGFGNGIVRVFEFIGNDWEQIGNNILGRNMDDYFGKAVFLSNRGRTVAVASPRNSSSVEIYDFANKAGWVQRGKAFVSAPLHTPSSISMSDDANVVAIGEYSTNQYDEGQVKVYEWSGTRWELRGQLLKGEVDGEGFGWAVSLSANGQRLAASAINSDKVGDDAGEVRTYEFSGSRWNKLGNSIVGDGDFDYSGRSISLSADGDTVCIGARTTHPTDPVQIGRIRVFRWDGRSWEQQGGDLNGREAFEEFGVACSLSADGRTVAGGAHYNGDAGFKSGSVRVFELT